MKKLSIILLALALALVMSVPAMAIHIGSDDSPEGSLGVTGRYQFDGEIDDIDGDTYDYFDDDLDIAFIWVKDRVKAYVSLEMSDRNPYEGNSGGSGDALVPKVPAVDNYYLEWNAFNRFFMKMGEYDCAFGRAIGTDGACSSNIELRYSLDAVDFMGVLSKQDDGSNNGPVDDGDKEKDEMVLMVDVKEAGPFTTLAGAYYSTDDKLSTAVDPESYTYIGVDLGVQLGPVGLAMEYGGNGGDKDGAFYYLQADLSELVGFINLSLNYFSSDEDYTAYDGNDWSPVLILGDNINEEMEDITVAWLEVVYDISDKLNVGGQFTFMGENDNGDEYGSEFDLGLNWKIADNVSYKLAYGTYSEGDGVIAGDVDRTETFTRLQLTF